MLRSVIITFEKRIKDDPRTFEELFLARSNEIKDLAQGDALKRMLALPEDLIYHSHRCSHCIIEGITCNVMYNVLC